MTKKSKLIIGELIRTNNIIGKALDAFMLSLEKCRKIEIKENMSFEEQESFDSLTSKYARLSDMYSQKYLTTIFIYLRENPKSFIDKANLAEKLNLVESYSQLLDLRDLRNEISHEYIIEELTELYKNVISYADVLINSINQSRRFVSEKITNP